MTSPLARDLREARARTQALPADLSDAHWMGPRLPIVNPIVWEVGHLGWFQEFWTLRHTRRRAPLVPNCDALYDSAQVAHDTRRVAPRCPCWAALFAWAKGAHDTRWDLPLLPRARVLEYLEEVLERSLEALAEEPEGRSYFHELALAHEDMHGEALVYTRQTLQYPAPPRSGPAAEDAGGGPLEGDAEIPSARFLLGASPGGAVDPSAAPFVFDNEKWAHPVDVPTFRIARAPVTNAQYAEVVEAGGR